MSDSKTKDFDEELIRQAEKLAIEFVRIERKAVYGDLKPTDKLKKMREELNASYKVLEGMEVSS